MKLAFVIIDMQKQFLDGATSLTPALASTAEYINYVSGLFRERGLPVLFVLDEEECKLGDPKFEPVDCIEQKPTDERIHKTHGNSFRDTRLMERLKALGVGFVLFAGYRAEGCVLSTLKGAENLDLPHAVLRNGILSTSQDGAAFVEKNSPLLSHHLVAPFLSYNRPQTSEASHG